MDLDIRHLVISNFMDSQTLLGQEVQKTKRALQVCVSAWAPL
jgi:hypothetical protein